MFTLLSPTVFSCFFIISCAKRIELRHECSSQGMMGVGWVIACTGFQYWIELRHECRNQHVRRVEWVMACTGFQYCGEIVYTCTKWIQNFGQVQNMDSGPWAASLDQLYRPDPLKYGLGPWTPIFTINTAVNKNKITKLKKMNSQQHFDLLVKVLNYFWIITSKREETCNIDTWKWVCGDVTRLLVICFVVSSFEITKFAMLKIIWPWFYKDDSVSCTPDYV